MFASTRESGLILHTKFGTATRLSTLFRRTRLRMATWAAVMLTTATAALLVGAPAAHADQAVLFRDDATDLCLDSNSSGNVYTLPCQVGNQYQTWDVSIIIDHGHTVRMMRDMATGRCLDSNGTGVGHTYTTNPCQVGNMYQEWVRGTAPNGDADYMDYGTFLFLDSNMLTGTPGCGSCIANKGDVYTLPYNGGPYQSWFII
jgi:hypothetical protein